MINKDTKFSPFSKLIQFKDIDKIESIDLNSTCLRGERHITAYTIVDQKNLKSENLIKKLLNLNEKFDNSSLIKSFFIRINGLSIENKNTTQLLTQKKILTAFGESNFKFYFNNKLITRCEQLKNLTIQHLFNSANLHEVELSRSFNKNKICPLIFQNVKIQIFVINNIMETFYIKQFIKFENFTENSILNLNSNIKILVLSKVMKLNLDQNLINPYVFKSLNQLRVFGEINSIEEDLFKNLKNMRSFLLDGQNIRKLFHKFGINWIKFKNQNIKVNSTNYKDTFKNLNSLFIIYISFNIGDYVSNYYEHFEPLFDLKNTFPDGDFCLYKDFPFDQLIHIYFDLFDYDLKKSPSLTCTLVWLSYRAYLFNLFYISIIEPKENFEYVVNNSGILQQISDCKFEVRNKLCSIKTIEFPELDSSTMDMVYYSNFFDGIFQFYFIPISSLIGFFVYISSIYVIKKSKVLKDKNQRKLFFYIFTISIINSLICFIELFRLSQEWPYGNSNGILNLVFVQYLKIFLFDFVECILKFGSNFVYIIISVIRCSYIGDKPEKFFLKVLKLNPKRLILFIFLV
ncbi:unnamed protein product [Brachionus calyciflorus]|uniref:Uncharacterized protein n=1 Tax=Brachionus calyciflorus TaxID=104777 RepID=A0A813LZ32_9BILA|nr:unnamed protein product [Brachionus calyciflorus]